MTCKRNLPHSWNSFVFVHDEGKQELHFWRDVSFYLTCIRSVMEYTCALFHRSLPQYLSIDLERCQKRALRIMFPDKEYDEALACTGLISLHERRENIAKKLFSNALVPGHKLHKPLLPRNVSSVALRKKRVFNLPVVRTDRCHNSFIFHHTRTPCKKLTFIV